MKIQFHDKVQLNQINKNENNTTQTFCFQTIRKTNVQSKKTSNKTPKPNEQIPKHTIKNET